METGSVWNSVYSGQARARYIGMGLHPCAQQWFCYVRCYCYTGFRCLCSNIGFDAAVKTAFLMSVSTLHIPLSWTGGLCAR